MPTNTDPAAVTNMVRRCADLKCTCDDNGFCPKCASGKLEGSGECECPARKALKRNREGYLNILEMRKLSGADWGERDGYGGRYGALTREEIEAVVAENNAALSAPCPCEELRRELSAARTGQVMQADAHVHSVHLLTAERDSLRAQVEEHQRWLKEDSQHAENQRLRAENAMLRQSYEWVIAEKHGAQADAEREKNVADSLCAALAELRAFKTAAIAGAELMGKHLVEGGDNEGRLESDLAASQERERLLREALAALIDTAKSYRSDVLGLSWDGVEIHGDPRWKPYFHHVKRVDRDTVIDEADAALATPEGTVRP